MTIREFASDRNFKIVGKLTYKGMDEDGCRWWTDEIGNDYFKDKNGNICIADIEGTVY